MILMKSGYKMKTLLTNKVKLTPEERKEAMDRGAKWNRAPHGESVCGIWKAKHKNGFVYGCNTHRAGLVAKTLKGAIKNFEFIKTTA